MKVGSLFSGCGLADYGLHQAGFELAWACEIEKQPRAVLRRHFPKAEIHFDVKEMIGGTLEPVELLFFGSPCQDLSVAGKRAGLAGERSGLFAEAMRIVDEMATPPRICVWENVCGALSSNEGADFATVLTEMGKRWSGIAYRVLDLQWFGVPQRRRRVFVVGHSGGWRSAAEILFEREGLRRNPPTRRKAGQGVAGNVDARSHWSGGPHPTLNQNAKSSGGVGCSNQELFSQQGAYIVPAAVCVTGDVTHCLRGEGFGASEDGLGRGTPIVPAIPFGTTQITSPANYSHPRPGDPCHPLAAGAHPPAVIYQDSEFGCQAYETAGSMRAGRIPEHQKVAVAFRDPCPTLTNKMQGSSGWAPYNEDAHLVGHAMQVRRLTPTECERLMGAPDGYTAWGIDDNGKRVEMADGPRYKMIGNGVGVPHSRWIGNRALASLKQ